MVLTTADSLADRAANRLAVTAVAPVIRQVSADTFRVTEPGGRIDTVTGTRPVTVPGPWVITKITHGAAR